LWLNEISEIYNIIHSTKLTFNLKILKAISATCSFIYYYTDNIVWLAKIGFCDKRVPFSSHVLRGGLKWGHIKDQFSLCKTVLELVIYIYTFILKHREDSLLVSKLDEFEDLVIKKNHQSYVYLRKIVILRRELRFIWVEILIYSMRLILLTSNLKLVGHHLLDPIFVSCCGLLQAVSVVFKSMKSKKNFYKLEMDDLKGECGAL
jgi:hypothetical protein